MNKKINQHSFFVGMRKLITVLLFFTSIVFAAQQEELSQPVLTDEDHQLLSDNIIALGELRAANSPLLGGAQGVIVNIIAPNSQAASVGIKVNDVVVSYGSTPVLNGAQLISVVKATPNQGQTISINVIRAGKLLTFSVKAGSIGIGLRDVSEQLIQDLTASQRISDLLESGDVSSAIPLLLKQDRKNAEKQLTKRFKQDSHLSLEVRRDKYMIGLASHLKNERYAEALKYFNYLERLNIKLDSSFNYFYGESLLKTGKPYLAIEKLYAYIKEFGAKGKYYKDALEMVNEAESKTSQ
jgi:tetratricopeptide (TPR) repeat protein